MKRKVFFISLGLFLVAFFLKDLTAKEKQTFEFKKESKKKTIAVLDFTANNVRKSFVRVIRNKLEFFLYETNSFKLLERDKINLIMKEKELVYLNSDDPKYAAQVGGLLASDYIITGSVNSIDKYTISVKVIEVKTENIVVVDSESFSEEEDFSEVTRILVYRLVEGIKDFEVIPPLEQQKNYDQRSLQPKWTFSFITGYVMKINPPLKDITSNGYSFFFSGGQKDFLIKNFWGGVNLPFFFFIGKDQTDYVSILPVNFSVRYYLGNKKIFVYPELAAGFSYVYIKKDFAKNSSEIEPNIKVGLNLGRSFSSSYSMNLGFDYYRIFEKSKDIEFYNFSIGYDFYF